MALKRLTFGGVLLKSDKISPMARETCHPLHVGCGPQSEG